MQLRTKIIIVIFIAAASTAAIYYFVYYGVELVRIKVASGPINSIQNAAQTKILFVGDIMFDRGIRYYADKNGGNEFIFKQISSTLLGNDLVVANLEGPITDNNSISINSKEGESGSYFFTFDKSLAKTLYNQNIRLVNLGNNHILNFGSSGLESTKNYLSQNNVSYFGGPEEVKSTIKNINGIKIAFVSYNEFYGDIETEKGLVIDEITKNKEKADLVIVFCHWGDEYTLAPRSSISDLARNFIDSGADLIIGSHPHVIQPMETYKGKRIYYSLGNFVFDQYFSEDVRKGLGVKLIINPETKTVDYQELRFYLDSNGQTVLMP